MTVLLMVLVILLLLLIVPFGVKAAYIGDEFWLAARVAGIDFTVFPREKKKKPEKEKKKKPAKAKRKSPKKRSIGEWIDLVKIGADALGSFRRKLTISSIVLYFVSASEDPYNAAMVYAYVNTAIPQILSTLEMGFNIKNSDIRTSVSFETIKPELNFEIIITINLLRILCIAFVAGFSLIKLKIRTNRENKRAELEEERTDKDGTAEPAKPDV